MICTIATPDFFICVDEEQQRLREHDIVIFQHPLYWYSCPALMKEWLDLVLEYGFAYGPDGNELKGKQWLSSVTAGGDEFSYTEQGHNVYSVEELLRPFERTAGLCGMEFLSPLIHYDVMNADDQKYQQMADGYTNLLKRLSTGER